MGDRCFIQVTVPRIDCPALLGLFERWGMALDWNADHIRAEGEEINYGGADMLAELQELEIPFIGFHGRGDAYSAARFAFDGETSSLAFCGDDLDAFLIDFTVDGEPSVRDIARVQHHLRVEKRAKEKVFRTPVEQLAACVENSESE
jgi:hypothetical protein